jgi:hypothetical protein
MIHTPKGNNILKMCFYHKQRGIQCFQQAAALTDALFSLVCVNMETGRMHTNVASQPKVRLPNSAPGKYIRSNFRTTFYRERTENISVLP